MSGSDDRADAIDLDRWTPADKATIDYAIELLRSTHLAEVRGAEQWIVGHPDIARPALLEAQATPSAQAAAVLLGFIGDSETVAELLEGYADGGEGLRSAVRAGLATMAERGVIGAAEALDGLGG